MEDTGVDVTYQENMEKQPTRKPAPIVVGIIVIGIIIVLTVSLYNIVSGGLLPKRVRERLEVVDKILTELETSDMDYEQQIDMLDNVAVELSNVKEGASDYGKLQEFLIKEEVSKRANRATDILQNMSNELLDDITSTIKDVIKATVYTGYEKIGEGYLYKIPLLTNVMDEGYIEQINSEIQENLISKVETMLQKAGNFYEPYEINYEVHIKEMVGEVYPLSIVIESKYSGDYNNYIVYNLDGLTGKKLDVLELKGITRTEFLKMAREACGKKFKELYTGQADTELYNQMFDKTISPLNITTDIPVFLNDEGKIIIIGNVYSLSGSESYLYEIPLN